MTNPRIKAYLDEHQRKLELLKQMWTDPLVQCYDDVNYPAPKDEAELGSVFLAGPTSRGQILEYNWRSEAVARLRAEGFKGFIFVPEPRGEECDDDFTDDSSIHHWESKRLHNAHAPVFWIPRNKGELIGLNTNFECGFDIGQVFSGRRKPHEVFIGWPDGATGMGLPAHYILHIAKCTRYDNLRTLCRAVAQMLRGRPH